MSLSLLSFAQQSDGIVNTLGYFDASYAIQSAGGARDFVIQAGFAVFGGSTLCSATAPVDPTGAAGTVACPSQMGLSPSAKCFVAQCRNTPETVPTGSQFYLTMNWGVCRPDTPAATCRKWSDNIPVTLTRMSAVSSSSVAPTTSSAAASTAVRTNVSSAINTDTSQASNTPQQQKGVSQDNSVAITVPIVSVVAIAAAIFLFVKYRNIRVAKQKLQQTDLTAVFQSMNNAPPPPPPSSTKPVSFNPRSNLSDKSASPLIKTSSSIKSAAISSTSVATLEQTTVYLDNEREPGTLSSIGNGGGGMVDTLQFGQSTGVTPASAGYQAAYQTPNTTPFHNFAYPPQVAAPDPRILAQPQYPGYYDQHGNYYFFATPAVPIIPFPPPSLNPSGQQSSATSTPTPFTSPPRSPVSSANHREETK
ncbi:hypothetical protein BJ741DRAFT_622211 [Chytriomyces cf. hyalinus JEL632]|nr:hypothetical protein BJ741DRAFT_622211 [Chytriomyces cf. hyalinus JEL632]